MEEKYCRGEAIGKQLNSIDDNMLGGDYFLKAKIEKERTLFNEKNHL
jgi:hypothetical protein